MKLFKKNIKVSQQEHGYSTKGSIRRKFLRIFIILGNLPIIALGIIGIVFLMDSRQQSIQEAEDLLLNQKTEEVARFIDQTLESFEINVSLVDVVPPSAGYAYSGDTGNTLVYNPQLDSQLFLLQGLLLAHRDLVEVAFINTLKTEETTVIPKKILPPPGKETKILNRQQLEDPEFNYFSMDCGLGREILTVEDCGQYAFYPSSDLFRAISSGKNYVGRPYRTLGGYLVTLGAPVKNSNGVIIAGIRGELSLKPLNSIFAQAILGEAGYAYLIDDEGRPIVISAGKKFPEGIKISNTLTEELKNGFALGGAAVYRNIFGETVVASAKPTGRVGLNMIVEWPYSDAYSIVYSIANQAVLFFVLILIAIIILSRTLAQQITKPISMLQFAAARIGKGVFDPISEIKTGDELENLAHSINDMAGELKNLDELKRKADQARLLELNLAREREMLEIKDSFLDTASHQLRTPISAIKWQLELLQGENIPPEDKELVAGAYQHAEFLSEISTDLINAASYGLNYKPKDVVDVEISKIISEVCDHSASLIAQNKFKFTKNFLEQPVKIYASYPALRVLFENLIGNAIRYTKPEGEITISIVNHSDSVEIRIADTGIGILPEEHSMIFKQFFRGRNAIEMRNVGTGLGLYIVKNIVDGHYGNIWFNSEIGKGTTFLVSFPLQVIPSSSTV